MYIYIFNCFGYCKRYCTSKHCLILLLNSPSKSSNILSLWVFVFVCNAQNKENRFIFMQKQQQFDSTNLNAFIERPSLQWLRTNKYYLKRTREKTKNNEQKRQKYILDGKNWKWMKIDIDRIIFWHLQWNHMVFLCRSFCTRKTFSNCEWDKYIQSISRYIWK